MVWAAGSSAGCAEVGLCIICASSNNALRALTAPKTVPVCLDMGIPTIPSGLFFTVIWIWYILIPEFNSKGTIRIRLSVTKMLLISNNVFFFFFGN